jgi:hypothetical protein
MSSPSTKQMNSDHSVVFARIPRVSKNSLTGPSTNTRLMPPKSSTLGASSMGSRNVSRAKRRAPPAARVRSPVNRCGLP